MSERPAPNSNPVMAVIEGVLRLGSGRADGISYFGTDANSVLSALAPIMALVGIVMLALVTGGGGAVQFLKVELLLCQWLLQPVLAHALAKRWDRSALWMRYAVASMWGVWLVEALVLIVSFGLALVAPDLARKPAMNAAIVIGSELYGLWLNWFTARAALKIGAGRALVCVVAAFGAVAALYGAAWVLPPHYNVLQDVFSAQP